MNSKALETISGTYTETLLLMADWKKGKEERNEDRKRRETTYTSYNQVYNGLCVISLKFI